MKRPDIYRATKDGSSEEVELRIIKGRSQPWVHTYLTIVDDEEECIVITFGESLANWNTDELRKFRDSMTEHLEYLDSISGDK